MSQTTRRGTTFGRIVCMQTKMKERVLTRKSANPINTESCQNSVYVFIFLLLRVVVGAVCGFIAFVVLSYLVACPPMHWFYEVADDAGPASIYLPGGGFSGFWFHLGSLYSFSEKHNLHDYDYYCFSAGCLSKSLRKVVVGLLRDTFVV